jgi:hypothetical protein
MPKCNGNEFIYNDSCVNKCPYNSPYVLDKYCLDSCFTIHNEIYKTCICSENYDCKETDSSKCESKIKTRDNSKFCKLCNLEKNYLQNNICSSKCDDLNISLNDNTCIKCNTDLIQNNTCVESCQDSSSFYQVNSCVSQCNNGFQIIFVKVMDFRILF